MISEASRAHTSVPVDRLGRYEILQEIAVGGMGTVFLGRVTGPGGFERHVALKVCHPHLRREPGFVSMFLDEARLLSRIHHPNVVGIVDVVEDKELYLVLEYVEGAALSALLRTVATQDRRIPPKIALR